LGVAPIRAQKTLGLSLPKAHEVGRKLEDLFHDFDQLLGYVFHVFFRVPSIVTMRRSISCQRMPQRVTR
jgi:hypothetical protein